MGRTILCPHCKSMFDEEVLKKKNSMDVCLVCGESLSGDTGGMATTTKEKTKWYYYKDSSETLTTTLYEDEVPLYTFDAVDVEDAKRQLKEVMPNSSLFADNTPEKVKCPYCRSEQVQIVQRKYSLLTGFATNKYDRVCLRCKRKF